MKSNIKLDSLKEDFFRVSLEQVWLELRIYYLRSIMSTTCSYYDYLEYQSELFEHEQHFECNEKFLKYCKEQINKLETLNGEHIQD